MTIYEKKGYLDRNDYLDQLGIEYGGDLVAALSDVLGPSEDFDGLPQALEEGGMCGF